MELDTAMMEQLLEDYSSEKADEYRSRAIQEEDAQKRNQLNESAIFFDGGLRSIFD
jgi:hypothetical protein